MKILPLSLFLCFALQAQADQSPRVWHTIKLPDPRSSYAGTEMISLLIALAEGDVPSREQIENKFEFRFNLKTSYMNDREYWGQAPFPFRQEYARNISYFESDTGISILLSYQHQQYCIRTQELQKNIGDKWRVHLFNDGHLARRVIYRATINSVERSMEFTPSNLEDDDCIRLFSVSYESALIR